MLDRIAEQVGQRTSARNVLLTAHGAALCSRGRTGCVSKLRPLCCATGALTVPMRGNVISTLERKNRDDQTRDEKETAEQKADDRDF